MPGFFISNTAGLATPDNVYNEHCVKERLDNDRYTICRNTLNKYLADKLFFETESFIVLLEGVILNKDDLIAEYSCADFKQTVLFMMAARPDDFFDVFRGTFSGAVYFKYYDEWLVFTDHIASRSVFYYQNEGFFAIGSELAYIGNTLRIAGRELWPELAFFQYKACYGFQLDKRTSLQGVYRLLPGQCMRISADKLLLSKYSVIRNRPDESIELDEAIEQLDALFKRNLQWIYEKDKAYGYQTIMDISGGMDSRAIGYVSAALGYRPAFCTCFSQTNTLEQRIAEEVINKLGFDYIFYALDSANHLIDVDELIRLNSGTSYYNGIGGMKRLMERLNTSNIGMSINGIFGDVYEGAHLFPETDDGYKKMSINNRENCKAYSQRLNITLDEACIADYDNIEQFLYTIRDGFGNMSTGLIKQNFVEAIAPFGDVDYLRRFYTLPRKMRIEQKVSLMWMMNKYPASIAIRYASTGYPPIVNPMVLKIQHFHRRVEAKIRRTLKMSVADQRSMNPFETWMRTRPEMSAYIEAYYQHHRTEADAYPEIQQYIDTLYQKGNALEKLLSVSLISLLRVYISANVFPPEK